MGKYSKLNERYNAFMLKRELTAAQRLVSMSIRLHVDLGGFKAYYEEI